MAMTQIFMLQFLGALVAWTCVATLWLRPAIASWDRHRQLAFWTTPLIFRFLGLGLLSPNLSPGLDEAFARNTAIGDSLTTVVALIALVALHKRWSVAIGFAWAAHIIGLGDLMIALPHAAHIKAALNMTAQWYVPAVGVPLMIVAHIMAFRTLFARQPRSDS